MRNMNKGFLTIAAFLVVAPLVVAQGPPPEQQQPPYNSRGNREDGPQISPGWHREGFGRRGRMHHRGHFGLAALVNRPDFRERLGITPEQAAKITQEEMAYQKARIRSRADMEIKRLELAELLAAEKPDQSLLDKKLREISDTRFLSEKASVQHMLFMKEALTPEQREKLKGMAQEFRGRQEMRGRGHFGPGGMQRRGPMGPRMPAPPQGTPPPKPAPPATPDN
jgi:Spy/CpxP family protein refolding chaperone